MLEKIIISNEEKELITHFVAFIPALSYCVLSNFYILVKAIEIQSSIKKNGDKTECNVLYSLFWWSNFWNEAAALCTEPKLQKVFKIRMIIYTFWIPLILVTIFLENM